VLTHLYYLPKADSSAANAAILFAISLALTFLEFFTDVNVHCQSLAHAGNSTVVHKVIASFDFSSKSRISRVHDHDGLNYAAPRPVLCRRIVCAHTTFHARCIGSSSTKSKSSRATFVQSGSMPNFHVNCPCMPSGMSGAPPPLAGESRSRPESPGTRMRGLRRNLRSRRHEGDPATIGATATAVGALPASPIPLNSASP